MLSGPPVTSCPDDRVSEAGCACSRFYLNTCKLSYYCPHNFPARSPQPIRSPLSAERINEEQSPPVLLVLLWLLPLRLPIVPVPDVEQDLLSVRAEPEPNRRRAC